MAPAPASHMPTHMPAQGSGLASGKRHTQLPEPGSLLGTAKFIAELLAPPLKSSLSVSTVCLWKIAELLLLPSHMLGW